MKTIQLNDTTKWVGKIDDRDVPFHRLMLTKGTTYNSYLIESEKATIIDTVDFSYAKEYVDRLAEVIDLATIQYIVINHTEPDHSGGLRALTNKAKDAIIVCSELAVYELKEMYKLHDREFMVVHTGDTLDIGGKTLAFYETPYLHTAETMMTYCVEDKILYSCDIFSTHVANTSFFDDLEEKNIMEDFDVYYKLIMHPHRLYVQKMVKAIKDLDVDVIAPSHGYILRKDAPSYIERYNKMSLDADRSKKGLVLYSSLTRNTKKISEAIQQMYVANGVALDILDVDRSEDDAINTAIEGADIVFFGTSTKYADMVGRLEDVLKNLETMDLHNKIGVAFGSFGWSGESIEIVQDYLLKSNIQTLETTNIIKSTGMVDVQFPIRIRFGLTDATQALLEHAIHYTIDLITRKSND